MSSAFRMALVRVTVIELRQSNYKYFNEPDKQLTPNPSSQSSFPPVPQPTKAMEITDHNKHNNHSYPQPLAIHTIIDSQTTHTTRKRSKRRQDPPNAILKPLLPRLPAPVVAAKARLPTPPGRFLTPKTPVITPKALSSPNSPETQTDLMPMLLQAAAQAAVRDKRQERMVKNRAAAYESRKRKREEAERLMKENKDLKARVNELERTLTEITRERDAAFRENHRLKLRLEKERAAD
ncbi:1446_t:CDS:2 [Paraglomus brasilianum]|uniref:1446_t:CDS:1 n=1 Tax=Paraglomus brasilianum TaxID=144538 RepID=A0A9N9BPM5_9GLOM|nr:1446_t:CDS:2 [Paraglomus brasilianum]